MFPQKNYPKNREDKINYIIINIFMHHDFTCVECIMWISS